MICRSSRTSFKQHLFRETTPEDFDAAFDKLDQRLKEAPRNSETVSEDGQEVLEGQVYDFEELERIDKGLAPVTFREDVQLVGPNPSSSSWDVESLLMFSGVDDCTSLLELDFMIIMWILSKLYYT